MISQNTIYADEEFDPFSGKPARPEYQAAAEAVLDFSKVVETTGNTKKDCVPMTREDVYQKVEGNAPAEMLRSGEASGDKLERLLAAARYLYRKETGPEVMLAAGGAPDLSEYTPREQEMLKKSLAAAIEERERRKQSMKTLLCSEGKAEIEDIRAEFSGENGEIRLVKLEVPEFILELEDSVLDGEAGRVILEELPRMKTLYALLYQQVCEQIRSSLLAAGRYAYEVEDK